MLSDCVQFPEVTPAPSPHCHHDTILTQTGGQPFLKINSRIVFENLTTVKTRARLLNRSLQVVELTPLLASQCQALNKKPRQNRLSCQKAVSSLLGARYFSRWCPISWPLPGSPKSHHHKSGGWDQDYFRRVKSENGLSDCQLRVLSSHLPSSQTIFSKLRILWILIRWPQLRFERHLRVHKLFQNIRVRGIEADSDRSFSQPSSFQTKSPATKPCKNLCTPHLFHYVLMRVSQIWVVQPAFLCSSSEN